MNNIKADIAGFSIGALIFFVCGLLYFSSNNPNISGNILFLLLEWSMRLICIAITQYYIRKYFRIKKINMIWDEIERQKDRDNF